MNFEREKALKLVEALEEVVVEQQNKCNLNASEITSAITSFFASSLMQVRQHLKKENKVKDKDTLLFLSRISEMTKDFLGEEMIAIACWEKIDK